MPKISKEITNILLEIGSQMLKIVKELNEEDKFFNSPKSKQQKPRKGKTYGSKTKSTDKNDTSIPGGSTYNGFHK